MAHRLDGYRTGRQLNLTRPVTVLGRAEHLPLPFLGPMNKEVEQEHLTIFRCPDGSYALEDHLRSSARGSTTSRSPAACR